MSNYSLYSPIDVTTSGTSGQINMLDSSGNFAVQLRSPTTLTANIPFVLPATNGATSDYLFYGSGAAVWQPPSSLPNTSLFPANMILRSGTSNVGVTATTATFTNFATIGFRGSTTDGVPTLAYIVVGNTAATGCQVRIFDQTNAVNIAITPTFTTSAGLANVVAVAIPIIPANVSTTAALWNIQMLIATGTLTAYYLSVVK